MNVLDWIIIVVLSPFALIAALYSIMILCMALAIAGAFLVFSFEMLRDWWRSR